MAHDEENAIQATVRRLRELALAANEGDLLGNEETLTRQLLVSVSTVRQAARLLEREGIVLVRRGRGGGYFAARPGERTIEAAITHIDVGPILPIEIHVVATAIWQAVVAHVTATPDLRADAALPGLAAKIRALRRNATFTDVRAVDKLMRKAIFKLSGLLHLELIANINSTFAGRAFPGLSDEEDLERQSCFVESWKKFALMQMEAIMAGDEDLAVFAAGRIHQAMLARLS